MLSRPVDAVDGQAMDRQIDIDECYDTVKQLSNGKSPRTDRLPIEFYKMFWTELKTYFILSLNEIYEKEEMSFEQRWGAMTLLTSDYKVLAKGVRCKHWPNRIFSW